MPTSSPTRPARGRVDDRETAHGMALTMAAQREVLAALRDDEHERAAHHARRLRHAAELLRLAGDRPAHAILELSGAARIGQSRAQTQLEQGRRMVELYPHLLEMLEAGQVLCGTVEMLLSMTKNCTDEVQLLLGRRISAELGGLDAADARRLIATTVVEVEADADLQAHKERHAQAEANRGVWVKPVADGMARIGAEVDEAKAHRFSLDLDELTRAQKVHDERTGVTRNQQQRRADLLAELPSRYLALLQAFQQGKTLHDLVPTPRAPGDDDVLETAAELFALPVRNPVTMYVHIPMTTVLDLDNRAGYVEGLGPVSAHRARLLRPVASLNRLVVDARTGVPIGIDPEAEPPLGEPDWTDDEAVAATAGKVRDRLLAMLRPAVVDHRAEPGRFAGAATTRLVQARDLGCVGPGCPRTARACELDHNVAHADGGLTASWNLDCKSTRCHHCRHEGWTAVRAEDGTTTWTSPLGSVIVRRSPWRRPPHGPERDLPDPTLDRPDGARKPSGWYGDPALDRPLAGRLAEDDEPSEQEAVTPELEAPPASRSYFWPNASVLRDVTPPPRDDDPERPLGRAWDPPPF